MEVDSMISDAGHDEDDRDHQALVALLEQVKGVCDSTAADSPSGCGSCSKERHERCCSLLSEFGDGLLAFMLDHFRHEDDLMATLRNIPYAMEHCARHRREHVKFSTRYNGIVANADVRNVASCGKKMESFIIDWIREHTLVYDSMIAGLLDNRKYA